MSMNSFAVLFGFFTVVFCATSLSGQQIPVSQNPAQQNPAQQNPTQQSQSGQSTAQQSPARLDSKPDPASGQAASSQLKSAQPNSAPPAHSQPTPAQQTAAAAALEFPVQMQQKVVAGKTPVGTRVEAHLTLATLLNGRVFPEGAVFTGVVVQSIAKSAAGPSRLIVRMDSVRWKNTAATIKAYLTAWYYPVEIRSLADRSDPPPLSSLPDAQSRKNGGSFGGGSFPKPSVFVGHPGSAQPETSPPGVTMVSEHRVLMKNVESIRDPDASVELTSSRSNIKIDKSTTYVLATAYLPSGK